MEYYVDRYGNVLTRKEYAKLTGLQQPRETQKTAEEKHEQKKKKEEGR